MHMFCCCRPSAFLMQPNDPFPRQEASRSGLQGIKSIFLQRDDQLGLGFAVEEKKVGNGEVWIIVNDIVPGGPAHKVCWMFGRDMCGGTSIQRTLLGPQYTVLYSGPSIQRTLLGLQYTVLYSGSSIQRTLLGLQYTVLYSGPSIQRTLLGL